MVKDVVLAVLVMVHAFSLAPSNELAWVLDVDFALQLDFRGIDVSAFVPDDEAERAVFSKVDFVKLVAAVQYIEASDICRAADEPVLLIHALVLDFADDHDDLRITAADVDFGQFRIGFATDDVEGIGDDFE